MGPLKRPVAARVHTGDAMPVVALAGSDLDDVLIMEIVLFDQPIRQRGRILLESRREVERILVLLGVLHDRRIEVKVIGVPTRWEIAQTDIAARCAERRFARRPKHIAMHRHLLHFD